jgi:hypothetical protein
MINQSPPYVVIPLSLFDQALGHPLSLSELRPLRSDVRRLVRSIHKSRIMNDLDREV